MCNVKRRYSKTGCYTALKTIHRKRSTVVSQNYQVGCKRRKTDSRSPWFNEGKVEDVSMDLSYMSTTIQHYRGDVGEVWKSLKLLRRRVGVNDLATGHLKAHEFEKLGRIGNGAFSVVYEAKAPSSHSDQRFSAGQNVAIKEIDLNGTDANMVMSEVRTHFMISGHSNVATLFSCGLQNSKLYMMMELLKGNNLCMVLQERGSFSEEHALICMKDILSGLQYMHSKGVAHMDLKPENVMLKDQDQPLKRTNLVLIDFGFATSCSKQKGSVYALRKAMPRCGTPGYNAPEVSISQTFSPGYADMFSIGVILYRLLKGKFPYGYPHLGSLSNHGGVEGVDWSGLYSVSYTTIKLMRRCFCRVAKKRPTAKEAFDVVNLALAKLGK